jgi:hypothetical protein
MDTHPEDCAMYDTQKTPPHAAQDQAMDVTVPMSVRLADTDADALRAEARVMGVRAATLARIYIVRCLRAERASKAATATAA